MIKMVRLDERLIHGQVATKWSRLLGVDRIIVADDDAAANDVMQKTLMMAAPDNVKVAIVPVDRAVALCNDPRSSTLEILAIVATPESLLKVVSEVRGVDRVNIGNYGRVAPKRGAVRASCTTRMSMRTRRRQLCSSRLPRWGFRARCRQFPMMHRET